MGRHRRPSRSIDAGGKRPASPLRHRTLASARWRREVPIFGSVNNQRVSGRIDLLIETDEGCVILDHKTFPALRTPGLRRRYRLLRRSRCTDA